MTTPPRRAVRKLGLAPEPRGVNESLDPANYHIRNMAERIRDKGDLWKPVIGRGINMEKCVERLGRLR